MPFANKFKWAMALPKSGDVIGDFTVVEVDVTHIADGHGRYEYPITMVLQGKGGQQGVRRAIGDLRSTRVVTFSGYGNPYQLSVGKLEVKSLGQRYYRVSASGFGARIFMKEELLRFFDFLSTKGYCNSSHDKRDSEEMVNAYLAQYQIDARRKQKRMW